MIRFFPMLLSGLVLIAAAFPVPISAQEKAAEDVLKEKGLRRAGTTYVLSAESEFSRKLTAARSLFRGLSLALRQQEAMLQNSEANKVLMRNLLQQRILLNRQLPNASTVEQHNRIVAMVNQLGDQITLLNQGSDVHEATKDARSQIAQRRDAYIQALIELRSLLDATSKRYAELADDAEVKEALAAANHKTKARLTLGPSRGFLANVKSLEKAEGGILTETIPLHHHDGVFWIDVTLNNKTTIPMVFDTGASGITLSTGLAAQAGLKPSESDRLVTYHIADGSTGQAKAMKISTVRVGRFTAEDVDCLIMPEQKTNVPPLLGGSFLRNFTFKMNQDAGTVTLSRIETADNSRPAARKRVSTRPTSPSPKGRERSSTRPSLEGGASTIDRGQSSPADGPG